MPDLAAWKDFIIARILLRGNPLDIAIRLYKYFLARNDKNVILTNLVVLHISFNKDKGKDYSLIGLVIDKLLAMGYTPTDISDVINKGSIFVRMEAQNDNRQAQQNSHPH